MPATRGRRPRVPRRRRPHPRRPVPGPQVAGGVRLRPRPRPETQAIAHLGTLDFVAAKDNVVFLGPPGTGKTHLATGIAIRACQAGHRVLFATASEWVDRLADRPPRRAPAGRAAPPGPLPAARRRRGRLHPLRTRSREPVLPARLLPLRTRLADRHLQQALRPLGRGLRRRRRRRRDDRPPRPPRRRHHPQRRLLPPQEPRPRPHPHHRGRAGLTMTTQREGSIFTRRQGVHFQPSLTPISSATSKSD